MPCRGAIIVFLVGFVVVAGVYSLGLSGAFLLDDYATLPMLEQWGQINNLEKLKQFVGSGFTGPTGRPVALFTFAVQSGQWPDSPFHFLLVNLVIHLVSAVLLFFLVRLIAHGLKLNEYLSTWLPVFVSLLWAAHPLNVSAVLYIIQRMVLLSTLFNLAALISYLIAREYCLTGNIKKALVWFTIAGFTALMALFSKEIAVLIPLQLLLLEAMFSWQGKRETSPLLRAVFWFGIVIPCCIVVLYIFELLVRNIYTFFLTGDELFSRRSFTVFERLLTQSRVVGDYLLAIIIPKSQSAGVFHDGYLVSTSLFKPVSTLVWSLIHLSLVVGAFVFRRKLPLLAFGILWFYVNHLVESTVVMLELKFEHRNYLPGMGILLAVAYSLLVMPVSHRIRAISVGAVFFVCVAVLALRASLWGNPEKAVLVWVNENKNSVRANENAAMFYSNKTDSYEIVSGLLRRAVEISDDDPVMELKFISYACPFDRELKVDVSQINHKLAVSEVNWQLVGVMDALLGKMIAGSCNQIELKDYRKLLASVKENPKYRHTSIPRSIADLEARSELVLGSKSLGIALYTNVNYKSLKLGLVMKQALWLASYGELQAAVDHLVVGIENSQSDEYTILQAEDMLRKIRLDLKTDG